MLKSLKKMTLNCDAHEFQPLLVEIEDSPVSPLGRMTFWIIIAVIGFFTLWLILGKVDIVVSARGKVMPDGSIKIVQPLETGTIRKIMVKEGDFVKKGQVLAEIDPSTTAPQLNSLKKNLAYLNTEAQRLNAQTQAADGIVVLPPVPALSASTQNSLYQSSLSTLNEQLGTKKLELRKVDEEIKSANSEKANYENLLRLSTEKVSRLKAVIDLIAKDDLIKAQSEVDSYSSQVQQTSFKLNELNHRKSQILEEMSAVKSDFKTQNLKELSEREKQTTQIQANIEEISFRNVKQKIVSPVDGYVNNLSIHTVGGVVTPAEKLISIVPANAPLVIKSTLSNRDVGFVRAGMSVAVKIDTFDFQKYGILRGKVRQVSKDSIEDPKLGPIYEVYITPVTTSLKVEGKYQQISSGMTLTSEIKVGKRRIIEFFIYPLIKYLNEGISIR